MDRRGSGCIKGGLIGCGVIVACMLVALLAAMIWFRKSEPAPPSYTETSQQEQFEPQAVRGLVLPELPDEIHPVVLYGDISMADLRLKPASEGERGVIRVDVDYDEANFEFSYEADRERVSVRFGPKRGGSLFSRSTSGTHANRIDLTVSRDLVLNLNLKSRMGSATLDLSGVAVNEMDVETSMGSLTLQLTEPNPIPLASGRIRVSMGDVMVSGLEQLRFQRLRVRSKMGSATLKSTGLFTKDGRLDVNVSLGECFVFVPPNLVLDARVDVRGGGYQGPSAQDPDQVAGKPRLTLRGEVSLGELKVITKE